MIGFFTEYLKNLYVSCFKLNTILLTFKRLIFCHYILTDKK